MGYAFGVGREAPAFVLTALDGSEISLRQYRGDWFPVLVFMPASTPDAPRRIDALSKAADALWGLRGQVLVLSDGGRDELARWMEEAPEAAVPLLPDAGAVAKGYGAVGPGGSLEPRAVIVDRAGKVVWMAEGDEAFRPAALSAGLRDVAR
ncbi:MAG TPA: redoxin domain-containing protein [Thermoleophilia bacterium]|nr:redoxin domain-containing protein [Thermoleophilia bacterium]HQG03232.1 redoxin domain-containing protein [Thermoleophilia bacterium]HQG54418.1 redoxin domain-containing protein [Thermoleophilia bacterium]HQJ97371.1 redoxin domain-containing protein [Thermoleophilia bacterium]